MLKFAHRGLLVAQHLPEFHAVHRFACAGLPAVSACRRQISLSTLCWKSTLGIFRRSGKIHRRIQKIAHRHIKALFAKPAASCCCTPASRKTADRIGRGCAQMREIIEPARHSRKLALPGANRHRPGKLPLQFALVVRRRACPRSTNRTSAHAARRGSAARDRCGYCRRSRPAGAYRL